MNSVFHLLCELIDPARHFHGVCLVSSVPRSVGTPSSASAVPTAATPAATAAAFATFFATFFSFDRPFGIVRLADVLAFLGARPFNLGAARLDDDLDLALVPFAAALALPRLVGFFMIPSD
jgi:hypothetical protein